MKRLSYLLNILLIGFFWILCSTSQAITLEVGKSDPYKVPSYDASYHRFEKTQLFDDNGTSSQSLYGMVDQEEYGMEQSYTHDEHNLIDTPGDIAKKQKELPSKDLTCTTYRCSLFMLLSTGWLMLATSLGQQNSFVITKPQIGEAGVIRRSLAQDLAISPPDCHLYPYQDLDTIGAFLEKQGVMPYQDIFNNPDYHDHWLNSTQEGLIRHGIPQLSPQSVGDILAKSKVNHSCFLPTLSHYAARHLTLTLMPIDLQAVWYEDQLIQQHINHLDLHIQYEIRKNILQSLLEKVMETINNTSTNSTTDLFKEVDNNQTSRERRHLVTIKVKLLGVTHKIKIDKFLNDIMKAVFGVAQKVIQTIIDIYNLVKKVIDACRSCDKRKDRFFTACFDVTFLPTLLSFLACCSSVTLFCCSGEGSNDGCCISITKCCKVTRSSMIKAISCTIGGGGMLLAAFFAKSQDCCNRCKPQKHKDEKRGCCTLMCLCCCNLMICVAYPLKWSASLITFIGKTIDRITLDNYCCKRKSFKEVWESIKKKWPFCKNGTNQEQTYACLKARFKSMRFMLWHTITYLAIGYFILGTFVNVDTNILFYTVGKTAEGIIEGIGGAFQEDRSATPSIINGTSINPNVSVNVDDQFVSSETTTTTPAP